MSEKNQTSANQVKDKNKQGSTQSATKAAPE